MKNKSTIAKTFGVTIALGALTAISLPAQASYDWNNWEPVLGTVHYSEDSLETRLNRDFDNGLIDSNELAMLRRNLDGIQAQEDEFRMDHNGLGRHDIKCLKAKLERFRQDLQRAEADKFDLCV
ncbi:MAG: hypothetical protein KC777_22825 [Cyanobacteria bacterium HKST-UBA02]|nr:hypothetical protein [Cyanobacteria bacterium HKST-UBA02]